MRDNVRNFRTALLLFMCGVAGCQRQLAPTPNVLIDCDRDPFAEVPEKYCSNAVEVFYATDRVGYPSNKGGWVYGFGRSPSLAFGICQVSIGKDICWKELCRQCRKRDRDVPLPLKIDHIHEFQRLEATPMPPIVVNGVAEDDPAAMAREAEKEATVRDWLSKRLSTVPKREIFLFVHGAGNQFEDSASTIAELWHFMGRQGIPMVYAWPSGYDHGWVQRYAHDRESGEFTIYHLKQFLRIISSCPELRRLHIIAHSRGTDVITTALRELKIECEAAGKDPRAELRIGNLVLAAADMDVEVVQQRIAAEHLNRAVEQLTMYVSQKDMAMAVADWLFGGGYRLGQARFANLTPEQQAVINRVAQLQIIEAQVSTDFLGHSYFHENPAAFSDLILLLRDNRGAGTENGRPLARRKDGFWEIHDGYPIRSAAVKYAPPPRAADSNGSLTGFRQSP